MITVVNMIPAALSGETSQDSEPNLAVNPADPRRIVGTAFSPNPGGGSNGPIYISTDRGNTWAVNAIVPSSAGSGTGTGDITTAFGWDGSDRLYAGILRLPGSLRMNILRTNNATLAAAMTVLVDRTGAGVDQPYIKTGRVFRGAGTGNDRVFVGNNDFNAAAGRTATVEVSLDGVGAAPPPPSNFVARRIEVRPTSGQDGPPIRPAIHIDGTIYAVFYRMTAFAGGVGTMDVVVVRDNGWAAGGAPFTALTDSGDGLAGQRVVTGVQVPFQNFSTFGQERFVMSDLAIAVDPRDSDNVYIAWADRPAANYNLHVRRSTDRGQTWSGADLRTITNAKNPALAINSRGRVAFAYQQLTGAGASQRWVTRLERTDNNFASAPISDVLATTPATAPAPTFLPYLGDYIGLQAVGRDFFGIFSANNTPDLNNFPQGVAYQRNANFGTNQLFANDGVTPVAVSIDPFFYHVQEIAPEDDFYVADWTDGATDFDLGVEPSIEPIFYNRSDVWNRRTNAPAGFDGNNRPMNQDPQQGGAPGPNNFGFARIRRRGTGSAAAVTAHFLVSEFGTGSNYADAGTDPDPVINFAAGDDVVTMSSGYPWRLDPTSSIHLCMAVEVSTPSDPIVAPSVLGRAPGWPTTDLLFVNDNNKAQRNMGVGPMAASGWLTYFGLVHNAALVRRDFVLRYDSLFKVPDEGASLVRIGERDLRLQQDGEVVLKGMQPGENRWIGVRIPIGRNDKSVLEVTFAEMVDNLAVNGFSIGAQPASTADSARFYAHLHADLAHRLAHGFKYEAFAEQEKEARKLATARRFSANAYQRFAREASERLREVVADARRKELGDPFGLTTALRNLGNGDGATLIALHAELLQRAHAHLTMVAKAEGDVADIPQTLRLQVDIYSEDKLRELSAARRVVRASSEFLKAFDERQVRAKDYPAVTERLLSAFKATAAEFDEEELSALYEAMAEHIRNPRRLQGANLRFLLRIAALIDR
jgi:hypothetical protein